MTKFTHKHVTLLTSMSQEQRQEAVLSVYAHLVSQEVANPKYWRTQGRVSDACKCVDVGIGQERWFAIVRSRVSSPYVQWITLVHVTLIDDEVKDHDEEPNSVSNDVE